MSLDQCGMGFLVRVHRKHYGKIWRCMIFWILTINPECLLTISSTVGKIGSHTLILFTWVRPTLLLNKRIHPVQLLLTQGVIVRPTMLLSKRMHPVQLLLTQGVIYLAQSLGSCLIQPITQWCIHILHLPGIYGKVTCPSILSNLFFFEHKRTPSGKKMVTEVQMITASYVSAKYRV